MLQMKWATLCIGVSLLGCATVRQEDLLAWQGAPTVELQVHPLFSTIPKSIEHLSDGVTRQGDGASSRQGHGAR